MRKLIMVAAVAVATLPSCSVFAGSAQAQRHELCNMAGHILIGTAHASIADKEFLQGLTEQDYDELGFEREQAKWIRKAIAQGVLADEPVPLAVGLYESCMLREV